jgi:pimeloyl-ACP methyl ester carboxylesterase
MDTSAFSKRLQLDQVNLHYLDYGGNGPRSMLLLHGGGANAHWFDLIGPHLTSYGRILAVDLRGHGDSTPAEPPVYTYDAYLQDLRALLRAEHLSNPILLGHSMGGMLSVKYAGTWPQEVRALIVCDARPVYSTAIASALRRTGQRKSREYPTQEDYIAHFRIRPDGLQAPQDVRRHIASHAGRQLPNGRWAHKIDRRVYAQRESIDTFSYWKQVTCPVLFLRAEHNTRLPQAALQQIRDACPQIEYAEVAGAGHHLVLDQPDRTVTLVQEFLTRHQLLAA